MATKEKEIFTTEEAAEMMGCSPSTIEEHARNRVLPGLLRPRLAQPVHLSLAIRIHPHGERCPGQHLAPGDAGQPLKTLAA